MRGVFVRCRRSLVDARLGVGGGVRLCEEAFGGLDSVFYFLFSVFFLLLLALRVEIEGDSVFCFARVRLA
jgi:hypothetical protein